jgi:hypothetical protein
VKLALVCDAVARPVPVIVTFAVPVAVDVPGTYCTVIVQVFPVVPDASTVVALHVPPVIEKVPPAVPTLANDGAAEKVNDAFPVLLTVMVPVLVIVFAGVEVNTGLGAENVAVAPSTVKVTELVVPAG